MKDHAYANETGGVLIKAMNNGILVSEFELQQWYYVDFRTNTLGKSPIYPTPPLGQDMTQGQFFKRSLAGLNSQFSFS